MRIRATKKDNGKGYKEWGKVKTDRFGNYELVIDKDDAPHQFVISTQFENEELNVKSSNQNNGWKGP